MSLDQVSEWIQKAIEDHWPEAAFGLVALLFGRYWGRRKARREWQGQEYLHRLMFSLNSIIDGANGEPTLAIRTLRETNVRDVFLNEIAVGKVLEAAGKTTETDAILPFAKEDRWPLLNAILNEVAETFALGTLARDMGIPVEKRRYVICLTNEVAGPVRTRKVRAMVVQRELLMNGAFANGLQLESEHHVTRIETLQQMRTALERTPDLLLEVELALPTSLGG